MSPAPTHPRPPSTPSTSSFSSETRTPTGPLVGSRVVAGLFALGLAVLAATVVLDAVTPSSQRRAALNDLGSVSVLTGVMLLGFAVVILRRPLPGVAHRVGHVLVAAGALWVVDGLAESWQSYASRPDGPLPGLQLAFWTVERFGSLLLLVLPGLLLLYPDGRLLPGRWRIAAIASVAATSLIPLCLLTLPLGPSYEGDGKPLWVDLDAWTLPVGADTAIAVQNVVRTLGLLALIVPVVTVFVRHRRSTGVDRARLRWLLWACSVNVLSIIAVLALPGRALGYVLLVVALAATGSAITIGLVRPDLLDIDRLLGATLVYGALLVAVLLADLAVLGIATSTLGVDVEDRGATLLGLLLVTVAYGPLRHYLWRLVRRLLLGQREDPYAAVSGLAARLEQADHAAQQLPAVAAAVASAFRLGYVRVEVDDDVDGRLVATHGRPTDDTQTLPITYRDEEVGRLVLARRGGRSRLTARDEVLLGDLVRQAALSARADQLAARLQRSREEIVLSREDERRRLRRDLHDGLGPSLGAVVFRIDAARQVARSNPERSDELLKLAKGQVAESMADVRRLVHDLRPPALDDVGLLAAIELQASRVSTTDLSVRVEAADLDDLPAAVEVAAYRIVAEALNNVTRHASASRATVILASDADTVTIEVSDDGVGMPAHTPAGVGLLSLRERAAELGGTSDVSCPPTGGTRVRAWLPLTSTRRRTGGTDG